jgi:dTDP-4-dehydrorhamnose reductase
MIRVLLTGCKGQLGQELLATAPDHVELLATSRDELNLADSVACQAFVLDHRPDCVLNVGAYTAVDRAESEPELAHAVNAGAPAAFANALAETGGRLLQVSTDFVFQGDQGHPYSPEQPVQPLGVYGASKAGGEEAVMERLAGDQFCILRTSWVYGPVGNNFCLTMMRLHAARAATGDTLGVVADQVGAPTSTMGLARACWRALERQVCGIHHWSDAGAASWYDFAVAIGELGVSLRRLQTSAHVRPIATSDYPTPARRPSYSLLDCRATRSALELEPTHWRSALEEVISHIPPS